MAFVLAFQYRQRLDLRFSSFDSVLGLLPLIKYSEEFSIDFFHLLLAAFGI